jgi:hypothetical protein
MTDRQSINFGRSRIAFGKYQGTRIDEVPIDYLEKICDPQPFIASLRRYLASPRIAEERNREDNQ